MVDLHRRVEPRTLTGTGMSADPEMIQAMQQEEARRLRADRPKPKKPFKQVLRELIERDEEKKANP